MNALHRPGSRRFWTAFRLKKNLPRKTKMLVFAAERRHENPLQSCLPFWIRCTVKKLGLCKADPTYLSGVSQSIFSNKKGLIETTHKKIPREPRISQKHELGEELWCLPGLKLFKPLTKKLGKCDIPEIRLADCLSIFPNLNSEIGFRRYVQTDRFCGLGSGLARSRQRVQTAAQVPSLAIPTRKSLTFPTTKSEPRRSASHM